VAIDGLLGLRRNDNTFSVDPCIPAMWPEYSLDWRHGRSRYRISVQNPEHQYRGVRSAERNMHRGTGILPVTRVMA